MLPRRIPTAVSALPAKRCIFLSMYSVRSRSAESKCKMAWACVSLAWKHNFPPCALGVLSTPALAQLPIVVCMMPMLGFSHCDSTALAANACGLEAVCAIGEANGCQTLRAKQAPAHPRLVHA